MCQALTVSPGLCAVVRGGQIPALHPCFLGPWLWRTEDWCVCACTCIAVLYLRTLWIWHLCSRQGVFRASHRGNASCSSVACRYSGHYSRRSCSSCGGAAALTVPTVARVPSAVAGCIGFCTESKWQYELCCTGELLEQERTTLVSSVCSSEPRRQVRIQNIPSLKMKILPATCGIASLSCPSSYGKIGAGAF